MPHSRRHAGIEQAGLDHWAVNTDAGVAARAQRHHAAVTGSVTARHSALQRELRGNVALLAERPNGFQHRWRAAGVDDCTVIAVQLRSQQISHKTVMAERSTSIPCDDEAPSISAAMPRMPLPQPTSETIRTATR